MAQIIDMPKLSDTMTVGTLVKWLKQEGEAVKSGDMLAEVETDKATMELECFFDGTLLKIFCPGGSQVQVGEPLCAVGQPGETVAVPVKTAPAAKAAPAPALFTAPTLPFATGSTPPAAATTIPHSAIRTPQSLTSTGRLKISPLARKLAAEKGVDAALVAGSGPGGRIVRADILGALAAPPAPAPVAPVAVPDDGSVLVPVSNMRAIIAKRLVESKTTIPHFYLDIEVDAGPLLELRAQHNAAQPPDAPKISVNDFILKAAAAALVRVPAVNGSWAGNAIRQPAGVHISFAVAIEDGLITPVIRDTPTKTLTAISAEVRSLAKRAKDKKLAPADFTGGTFCVTNLGMMGIERFSAIINPPNAAILAVGATVKKPVVRGDAIVIGQRMTLTLSCDHRVVDGAVGATYLGALRDLLEKPDQLLA